MMTADLRAKSPEELRTLAAAETHPLRRGALLLRAGDLEAAHELFQHDESELGAFWHGLMHRAEGDYANAKYWFARARNLPRELNLNPNALTDAAEAGQAEDPALWAEWATLWEATR
jgi:hypothetical protein